MNIKIKISRQLENEIRRELQTPHKFAFERVGFISSTHSIISDTDVIIFLTKYHHVSDDEYIEDDSVGARINGAAIRNAMQNILSTGNGMFHVHIHDVNGIPKLSQTDRKELPPIVQNFRNVDKKPYNGIFLLSNNSFMSYVSIPGKSELVPVTNISVVGFPLSLSS